MLPVVLDDGTRKYVFGLGSARAITDASGSVVQTYQTDEFGVPTQTQGSSTNPFQYTGEQRDAESGFVYLRARVYDPNIGRFMSRDSWAGILNAPSTLNRFSYVENNPVNRTDPTGLKSNALLPMPCGGIFSWFWFCMPKENPAAKGTEKRRLQPCPGKGDLFYTQSADPYFVTGNGPEPGPRGCHINVRVMSGPQVVVNWHVYYEDGQYMAEDSASLRTTTSRSAGQLADYLVDDIAYYIARAKDPMAIGILWGTLPGILTGKLRELSNYSRY